MTASRHASCIWQRQVARGTSGHRQEQLAVIPRTLKDWMLLAGIMALWTVWFAVGTALRALV